MPALTRIGDICSGHDCFPPRASVSGSSNVFTNGIGTLRLNDVWQNHTCGDNTHNAISVQGSSTVSINGLPAVRLGDMLSCGSASAQGSSNTFCG